MGKMKRTRQKQKLAAAVEPQRASRLPYLSLGVILVVALAIRIHPVVYSPEASRGGRGMFGDTYLYHAIAYNLYKGNGFSGTDYGGSLGLRENKRGLPYEPAIVRAPLYPLFLAGVYTVFGSHEAMRSPSAWRETFDRVRLTQCVLDAFVCLLVFFITRSVFPAPAWPALVAATLYAFSAYNIFYTRALLTESLATFLVAASTLLTILGLRQGKPLWWFLAGAGWGVTALCRPEYLPFNVVIVGLPFLANWRRWRILYKSLIAVVLGVVLTVTPWVLRNYVVFKQPVLTVGGLGYSLFLGTFETNTNWTGWNQFPAEIFADAREAEAVESLDRTYTALLATGSVAIKEVDDRFLKLALERIRHDPGDTLKTWVIRIPRLWYQFYIPMHRDREASGYFFILYFVFALYAFVRAPREEKLLMGPMGLLCIYVTLIYLPLHIEPRYSVLCMPGLISLSGIGLWKAWYWGVNLGGA